MANSKKLIIFTKNLIAGTIKTRIAIEKGNEIALYIYTKLLAYTREITNSISCEKVVYFNDHITNNDIWDNNLFQKKLQSAGDLGKKMSAAFELELNDAEKVIIIGSDCPTITKKDIENAFDILDKTDVVIGPAIDGGYYLLGMKNNNPFLFENMPWSQENLLEITLQKLQEHKITYNLLDLKSDIDYWKDWEELGWSL